MADHAGIAGARLGPLLAGGNANVTQIVESDQGRLVLRHPPTDTVSEKAGAGIEREFRLLQAIADAAPVPRPLAWCDDPTIIGARFALTQFIDGVAITDQLPDSYANDAATIDDIGTAMIDGIAAVHSLDWHGRLPERFGRPEGFLNRQIDRWLGVRAKDAVRDLPLLESVAQWLVANLPSDGASRIIHCDYHLDNCLFDRSQPRLRTILDWEMATIGDPMLDLGLMLMFWRRDEQADLGFRFVQRISNRPDVVDPRVLADRWSEKTGLSSDKLDYYRVFAFWRLAAIVEGAYVLQKRGSVDTPYARGLEQDVPALLAEAARLIG